MLGVTSKKKCPDTEKAPLSALHISKSLEIELSDSPLIFDYSDEVFSRQIKPLIPKPAPIAAAGYTGSVHRALISKFRALETGFLH